MKKLLFYLAGVLTLICCSQPHPQPTNITVECTITGIPDSASISFLRNEGQLGKFIEKGYFKDGKLSFTYTPDSSATFPMYFSLYGDSLAMGRLVFYSALGTTTITGNGTFAMNWKAENNTPEQLELNKLTDAIREASAPYSKTVEKQFQFYAQKIYKGAAIDSLYKEQDEKHILKLNAELDYLKTLKTLNAATMNELSDLTISGIKYGKALISRLEELRSVYKKLTPQQQNSIQGEEIKAMIYPPQQIAIGDTLPDNLLYDTAGNSHKLSDYSGKYIILDFWSCGCGPCLAAGDEIKEVQEKFKDKLTIISITTDYEKTWRDASVNHNITWTNLSDYKGRHAGFCAQFTFEGIPYFMIADKSGRIIGDWSGYGKGIIYDKVKEFCK